MGKNVKSSKAFKVTCDQSTVEGLIAGYFDCSATEVHTEEFFIETITAANCIDGMTTYGPESFGWSGSIIRKKNFEDGALLDPKGQPEKNVALLAMFNADAESFIKTMAANGLNYSVYHASKEGDFTGHVDLFCTYADGKPVCAGGSENF